MHWNSIENASSGLKLLLLQAFPVFQNLRSRIRLCISKDMRMPVNQLPGQVLDYITDGKKNAKIAKDTDPKKLSEAEAKKLLAEAPARKSRRAPRKRTK